MAEIAKCALLGRVSSRFPASSVPAAVRGTSARTTCGRLASGTFRESGAGTHLIPTSSCRAAIKLRGVINGLRRFTAAKKAISRTNREREQKLRRALSFFSFSLSGFLVSIPISSSLVGRSQSCPPDNYHAYYLTPADTDVEYIRRLYRAKLVCKPNILPIY